MSVLVVNNLCKTFTAGFWPFTVQSYTAVNNVSLQLQAGEILGFLGPNGAGKTTTIQMLLGTLTPTSGTIAYFGEDFAKDQHRALNGLRSVHDSQCVGCIVSIGRQLNRVCCAPH